MILKRLLALLILLFFLAVQASAQNNEQFHLKLLAVQEAEDGYEGSDADLYLELKEGSGRVFLETFPLTKMDTQISTRFAKEVACNHFKLDCRKYDFIFTIKAKSSIIGGPSAGAAIAALTTIAVLDMDYKNSTAVTGTINSGGLIGPVGGLKEKIEAASKAKLQQVLIAKGSALQKISSSASSVAENEKDGRKNDSLKLDLRAYGKENLSIDVLEVLDLDEVIIQLTGVNLNHKELVNVTENEEYRQIMNGLQNLICDRTVDIENEIKEENLTLPKEEREDISGKKEKALNASLNGDHYAAASICFGNNIQLKTNYYNEKKISLPQLNVLISALSKKAGILEKKVDEEVIETIADLQTYMIVKERLNDVKDEIEKFRRENATGEAPEFNGLLAYAEERYFSAVAWTQFFSMKGKKIFIDKERLKNSCLQKISEGEERLQYASIFLGSDILSYIGEKIDAAKKTLEKEEFELCLIIAAQAKADADAIISSLGLSDETIPEFIAGKQKAVERIIFENSAEGMFPILGYSYYRYALSFEEDDKFSRLLYLEYALEMSNLDIYFPEEQTFLQRGIFKRFLPEKELLYVLIGIVLGILITVLYRQQKNSKKNKKITF